MSIEENDILMQSKDQSGNSVFMYPITKAKNVDGIDELVRNNYVTTSGDGSAYTATVEGIASLTAGVSFTMIPHVESTATNPTLNVNGLGAKLLRRRVSTSTNTTTTGANSDWLSAGKPINVFYDGNWWIADLPRPNANDILGSVSIQNGGTGATTAADARVNLGIETINGTVTSTNADYAEVGEWHDGNTNSEDRVGYFVCVDLNNPGVIIRKGASTDDIKGVTVSSPAFSGNCSSDKFDDNGSLLPKYSYVAVTGIVQVIDNGTCTVGERCMPTSDGTAGPVSGDYGYLVMDRVDDTHVLISIDPSITAQYKFKNYIDDKFLNASPDLEAKEGEDGYVANRPGYRTVNKTLYAKVENLDVGSYCLVNFNDIQGNYIELLKYEDLSRDYNRQYDYYYSYFNISINKANNFAIRKRIKDLDGSNCYCSVYERPQAETELYIVHDKEILSDDLKSKITNNGVWLVVSGEKTCNYLKNFEFKEYDYVKFDENLIPENVVFQRDLIDYATNTYVDNAITGVNAVPRTTVDDNGKFLRVVNGVATWQTVQNAEEVTF